METNMKTFALNAKQRLKNNFYKNKSNISNFGGYSPSILTNVEIKTICEDDTDLYNKVVSMLSEEDVVANPISRLTDKMAFSKLNQEERERYVLNLSEKFKKAKSKYESQSSCIV